MWPCADLVSLPWHLTTHTKRVIHKATTHMQRVLQWRQPGYSLHAVLEAARRQTTTATHQGTEHRVRPGALLFPCLTCESHTSAVRTVAILCTTSSCVTTRHSCCCVCCATPASAGTTAGYGTFTSHQSVGLPVSERVDHLGHHASFLQGHRQTSDSATTRINTVSEHASTTKCAG